MVCAPHALARPQVLIALCVSSEIGHVARLKAVADRALRKSIPLSFFAYELTTVSELHPAEPTPHLTQWSCLRCHFSVICRGQLINILGTALAIVIA